MTYHNAAAIKMEEYVPLISPIISGNANSRMEDTPRINSSNTMMMVAMFAEIGLAGMTVVVAGRKRA